MRKPTVALFGLGLMMVMSPLLSAKVDSLTHRYELHIDPIKQRVYICELCDTASERIVSENRIKPETTVTFQPGDEVDVIVDNGNPVLFKYEFGGVEAFKNSDAAAVEKFFESLKLVPALLPTPSADAVSKMSIPQLTDFGAFQKPNESRDAIRAEVESNVPEFRKQLFRWVKLTTEEERIAQSEAALRSKGFNDDFFTKLDARITQVHNLVGQLPDLMSNTGTPGRAQKLTIDEGGQITIVSESGEKTLDNSWVNVRNKVSLWDLQTLAKELKQNFKKLDDANVPPFDTGKTAFQIARYAARARDVGDSLATLIRFSGGVDALGKRVRIVDEHGKPVILDYDTLNDRKYTIKINFKTAAEGLPKEVRTSFDGADVLTGDFKIIDQPFHRIHVLGGGPAFVYNLIKTPQFLSDKDTDGNLVIKKKLSDRISGQDVAAMLNVIPTGWDDPFFAWAFQLGITPKKDNLAAYVGTGALFKSYFFIGGGFVVQQVDRLAPGLTVGQVIAKAEDLKTAKEYKTGVYLTLTVNLGTKK